MTARQAHLAPAQIANPGTEAACGYRITGDTLTDDCDVCPRCAEILADPGPDALLVIVTDHEHTWESAGSSIAPGGWSPAYRCTVCGQVIIDIRILRKVADAPRPPRMLDPEATPATY